jgi:DNA end-binding protein Ku
MTEDFDPTQYKDTYREALESLVQAKIEGNDVVRPAGGAVPASVPGGPADLTETLRASVEAAKANRGAGPGSAGKDGAAKQGAGKDGDAKAAPARQRKTAGGSRRKASA